MGKRTLEQSVQNGVQEDEFGVGGHGVIGRGWIRAMENWMTLGRPQKS